METRQGLRRAFVDWNWSRALLTLEGEHRTVDATLKSTLPLADIDILLPGRGDQEQESGQALRMKIEQLPQKDPDRREEEEELEEERPVGKGDQGHPLRGQQALPRATQ